MLTAALEHIDQIVVRNDVVQPTGDDQALEDPDVPGRRLDAICTRTISRNLASRRTRVRGSSGAIRPRPNLSAWRCRKRTPIATAGAAPIYLRFRGQYFDQETQLQYNYFRDYDPGIGRYVQADPIGLHGSVNAYRCVDGNPPNYFDPLGLAAQCNCHKIIEVARSKLRSKNSASRTDRHPHNLAFCHAGL